VTGTIGFDHTFARLRNNMQLYEPMVREELGYPGAVEQGWLQSLAAQREVVGSAQANAWLQAFGQALPEEIIILPGDEAKRLEQNASRIEHVWPTTAGLDVYPNPSNGPVLVTYDVPESTDQALLRVLDLSGRVLHTVRVAKGPSLYQLQTDGWAAGVYLVELQLDASTSSTTKLIIQR